MSFQQVLDTSFPNSVSEAQFVASTFEWLSGLGFSAENSIACVACCRDELTSSIFGRIEDTWGEAFSLASLAGFVFAGKTGFGAAFAHAPTIEARQRYVIFAFPHIGINAAGQIGVCRRPGQAHDSTACGALVGAQKVLSQSGAPSDVDLDDIEMSLLLQRLADEPTDDLVALTKAAHEMIVADLERVVGATVDVAKSDYAILTGIQLHTDDGQAHLVWPQLAKAVVNGETVMQASRREAF